MLYITIILVASGLFLIIYSLFTSSPKKVLPAEAGSPSEDNKRYIQSKEKEPAAIEEFTTLPAHKNSIREDDFDAGSLNLKVLEDDKNITKEQDEKDWRAPELDDLKEPPAATDEKNNDTLVQENVKETRDPDKLKGNSYSAILYEDSSNIFDYDNRSSIIDSTLSEYKKIKRIGKGVLDINQNSLCFTAENKNFKYDFHRIAKIRGGNNYIALFLKKSKNARLFIFDKDSSIGIKIERIFNDYSRGAA